MWQWIAKLKAHVHTRAQPNTTNTQAKRVYHLHTCIDMGGITYIDSNGKAREFLQFPNHHILFYMCKRGEMNRNVEIKKKKKKTCIRCVFDVRQSVIGIMLV